MPQTFSAEEANALLPTVRPLAESLVRARAEQRAAYGRLAEFQARLAGNGGNIDPRVPARLAAAAANAEKRIAKTVTSLQELGVVVKDADVGLVDFPSQRAGVDVFLCWQLGEESVAYWHGLDEGFAGRKPL